MIGDDTEGVIELEEPQPGVPGSAPLAVADMVPSDTDQLDEEQARRTPRPTELPDHPAP